MVFNKTKLDFNEIITRLKKDLSSVTCEEHLSLSNIEVNISKTEVTIEEMNNLFASVKLIMI